MTSRAAWEAAERVLCVRLDSLGDVLMATPAMRALRESRARRRITLLTSPAGAAIARLVPEVDDVIEYDAPWMKATSTRSTAEADRAMLERLRLEKFDAAVVFTTYSQSALPAALMCQLADIPLRLAHARENPYQLLTEWVREPEPEHGVRHEVQRQLDLVATVGAATADERLSLAVPPEARRRMLALLSERGVNLERAWAVLHPGATAPSRRYAPAGYAEAARRLAREDGLQIVVTGSEDERALAEEVASGAGAGVQSLAGALDLSALVALISLAPLLISNNTGPAHIAAAVGTPVVDLYALTNPQHTPWAVPSRVLSHDVPCRNCYKSVCPMGHHDCLRLVPPSAVVEAARELLALPGGGRP